jgi:hypothetical protein
MFHKRLEEEVLPEEEVVSEKESISDDLGPVPAGDISAEC